MIAELQNIARLTGAPPYTSFPLSRPIIFSLVGQLIFLQGGAPPGINGL